MTNGGLRSVNTKWMRLLLIAVLALCMGTVAACGDDDSESSSSDNQPAATADAGKKIKVGMVTDIGGLNDRSFN